MVSSNLYPMLLKLFEIDQKLAAISTLFWAIQLASRDNLICLLAPYKNKLATQKNRRSHNFEILINHSYFPQITIYCLYSIHSY